MSHNMSRHAEIRSQQRSVSSTMIDIIMSLGAGEKKPGKAYEWHIDKKELSSIREEVKKLHNALSKISNKRVLTDDSGLIITVYNSI